MSSSKQVPEHTIETGADLGEAFADSYVLFSETTQKYMEAYKQLEEQFEYLNVKLEETNNQLRQSLAEKDRVSNYLNNILESMSGGVLVLDLEGRITLFNTAAEEITGLSQEEVVGHHYEEIMGEDPARNKSALCTLDSGQNLQTQQKDLKRADGRTIPLGFSTSFVKDHNGEILGALEAFNDLTEEEILEEIHLSPELKELESYIASFCVLGGKSQSQEIITEHFKKGK